MKIWKLGVGSWKLGFAAVGALVVVAVWAGGPPNYTGDWLSDVDPTYPQNSEHARYGAAAIRLLGRATLNTVSAEHNPTNGTHKAGVIGTAQLADGAVTLAKIADTSAYVLNTTGAVTETHLATGAVTADKLAAGAVTADKLAYRPGAPQFCAPATVTYNPANGTAWIVWDLSSVIPTNAAAVIVHGVAQMGTTESPVVNVRSGASGSTLPVLKAGGAWVFGTGLALCPVENQSIQYQVLDYGNSTYPPVLTVYGYW